MPNYAVKLGVGGNFPPLQQMSPITILEDTELSLENNAWSVRVLVDAESDNDAIERATVRARERLILFQIFLVGSSTPFDIHPIERGPFVVENLSNNQASNIPNVVISARLTSFSGIFADNIGPYLQTLREVSQTTLDKPDCKIILHYYARAMSEDDDLYKFLNYITVIEAMLSESQETTEKISRRLAVLVVSLFPNLQDTFSEFKTFYRTRSEILHGDKIPSLTKSTIGKVSEFARAAVRNYLLLRKDYQIEGIKSKLDSFFDPDVINQIKQATAF